MSIDIAEREHHVPLTGCEIFGTSTWQKDVIIYKAGSKMPWMCINPLFSESFTQRPTSSNNSTDENNCLTGS